MSVIGVQLEIGKSELIMPLRLDSLDENDRLECEMASPCPCRDAICPGNQDQLDSDYLGAR